MKMMKATCWGALFSTVLLLLVVPGAWAAASDPLFVLTNIKPAEQNAPEKLFEGPCGIGVDSTGDFYVGDYYHDAIEFFSASTHGFQGQLSGIDSLDGPCGVAFDSTNRAYVNDYHRAVIRYGTKPSFGGATTIAGVGVDGASPTGIAVDPTTDRVYVDERTQVAVFESSGAPVLDGEGHPLHIGVGALQDAFGAAFGGGRLYVADAADETVKVFEPAVSTTTPVATISGPPGGFHSLRDTALALDRSNGTLYVADQLTRLSESPEAAVDLFSAAGAYLGQLKYNIVDAEPPGLAVDNSGSPTQSRVYVTSGNTEGAILYAYGPNAQTPHGLPAASSGAVLAAASTANARTPAVDQPLRPRANSVAQKGPIRVSVEGALSPRHLPRTGLAPISVSVGWSISTTDESKPPSLKELQVEINRHGQIDTTGLPLCPLAKIQPASSDRALANCRSSLVGQGSFSALVGLGEQEGYAAHGRLLVFNGQSHGKPVLFGQIYSSHPFSSSFVIPFAVSPVHSGAYGTMLSAKLPAALRNWGNLTAIKMTLSRRYGYRGTRRSYLSGNCPAPKGFPGAVFPLARTTFAFAGEGSVSSTLTDSCKVR
jgi:DNA-binding beta-propeller fold protein YncE